MRQAKTLLIARFHDPVTYNGHQALSQVLIYPNNRQLYDKALAKLANIAGQTLLFVSESLAMDKKVTPDFRWKQ